MLDRRLHLHLATWLGQWPAGPGLHVVGSGRRTDPPGAVHAGASGVLSVAPDRVAAVRELVRRPDGLLNALPAAVGYPRWAVHDDVFRWSVAPADLPDVGEWAPPTTPGLPSWLRLFDRSCSSCATSGAATWPASGSSGMTGTDTSWRWVRSRRRVAAAWPADWWPRRLVGCSTTVPCRPICTTGATPPRLGWRRPPGFPTGAGAPTASTRADHRPAGRGPWIPGRIHGPQPPPQVRVRLQCRSRYVFGTLWASRRHRLVAVQLWT